MNLCDNDHEEICYEGRNCPCCDIIKEKVEIEKELEEVLIALKESEEKVAWYKETITPEVIQKSPELLEPFLLKE